MTGTKIAMLCVASLLLGGCAETGYLIEDSGTRYPVDINITSKQMSTTINGKLYTGFYITDSSAAMMVGQTYGSGAYVASNAVGVIPGHSGRAVLTASDGTTIQCIFNYQGYSAIGNCHSNDGRQFMLTAQPSG